MGYSPRGCKDSDITEHLTHSRAIENQDECTKKVKMPLFADKKILYIEKPKDATRKLLKLINKFS